MIISYEEQIYNILKSHVKKKSSIVICPFGERGQQVKRILNTEFQMKEKFIVDNYYTGEISVIKNEELMKHISSDMLVLLCCENDKIKKQIQEMLLKIPDYQIVDVFPTSNIYINDRRHISIETSMMDYLKKIHSGLQKLAFENDNMVYSILGKYEARVLAKQFEEYIENKSPRRSGGYSLLLSVLLKEIHISDTDCLIGNANYRDVNNTYPANIYEEIYYLEKENRINSEEAYRIKDAYEMRLFTRFPGGHVVPDYEMILESGIHKLLLKMKEKLLKENDGEKRSFYESEIIVIRALQELIKRYEYMACKYVNKNAMFQGVVQNCKHIAYEAPNNFEQALQLLWFSHELMIMEGNIKGISLGRMDQYLYPFYKQDISANVINREYAKRLICTFCKKLSFDRKALSFQNITLGGDNKKSNSLTILFLDAQLEIKANQPMLSLRVNEFTSEAVWSKALEVISTGIGMPALFNDEIIVQAKMRCGINRENAENYSIVGCVEPTIGGKEYSHTEGLRLNVAKLLELIFFEGTCPITERKYLLRRKYKLTEFVCFEEFYMQYKAELLKLIQNSCYLLSRADISYGENWPVPYLSLFMKETLERGVDVTRGGTKYCNLSINFAGMANVVNSLFAIKTIVFDKKLVSFSEIPLILKKNFVGYEWVEREIENIPKYGNNEKNVDAFMEDLTGFIISSVEKCSCNYDRKFQVGFYTVVLHAEMGKYMLASFDGRKEKTALASSLSPTQGTDVRGPLAVFQSICKTPMSKMANGMVLDLRFSPQFFCKSKEKMKEAILTYFSMGGMEVQFNVVDQETLNQAQLHPEKYKNLLVRVSGFSSYFVELEKEVQNEIILRYVNTKM